MAQQLTIGQLAKAVHIPTTTVRYYERIGLVEPEGRSQGNYRLYNNESLKKLKFIRAAQAIGFTLEDVKSLFIEEHDGTQTCRNIQSVIEGRLAVIEERLKDLRHVRKVLSSVLDKCQKQEQTDYCHVVKELKAS